MRVGLIPPTILFDFSSLRVIDHVYEIVVLIININNKNVVEIIYVHIIRNKNLKKLCG